VTTPGPPTTGAEGSGDFRVAVVLASAGRPELLGEVVEALTEQSWRDFTLVLSVPDATSLPERVPPGTLIVHGRGLPAQRNAGLDAVPEATHVFFFDDDALPREDYLEQGMAFFAQHQEVVGLTGRVLLDGATGEAIPSDVARGALQASWKASPTGTWQRGRELYGCNFAYRRTAAPAERFDDRLPLYGWLEDHDFARRLMPHGALARVQDCVAVHERLGYSQVMNPSYLMRKGSFPLWLTVNEIGRRLAKNVVRSAVHEERDWRRRRLRGNLRAFGDVARGRFTPERILDIPSES
jgi:hypothetical protein